jgi:hypothetical protein
MHCSLMRHTCAFVCLETSACPCVDSSLRVTCFGCSPYIFG